MRWIAGRRPRRRARAWTGTSAAAARPSSSGPSAPSGRFSNRPGPFGRLRGLALTPLKSVLRKPMRWYVEPLAVDQRRFNAAAFEAPGRASRTRGDRQDAARNGAEVAEALRPPARARGRARRAAHPARASRASAAAPAAPAPAPHRRRPARSSSPTTSPSRAACAGRRRAFATGSGAYVDDFRDAAPVLDLGCGRGEFLGAPARGGHRGARRRPRPGHGRVLPRRGPRRRAGRRDRVPRRPRRRLARRDLRRAGRRARAGPRRSSASSSSPPPSCARAGLLVAETINPLSPLALRNYFADLTHAQPLVPETLELLATPVRLRLGRGAVRQRARGAAASSRPDPTIAANVRRLNELLFAPLDYAHRRPHMRIAVCRAAGARSSAAAPRSSATVSSRSCASAITTPSS